MSPQGLPQPKLDGVMEELNKLWCCFDLTPYLLTLKRIKTEAESEIKNTPVRAYTILGAVACVEERYDKMRHYHENAIRLADNDISAIYQYVSSLSKADMDELAYEWGLKGYDINSSDPALLQSLMTLSYKLEKNEDYEIYKNKLSEQGHEFLDPAEMPLDNNDLLEYIAHQTDDLMESHPELIEEPDPELIKEIDDLIGGVDIS